MEPGEGSAAPKATVALPGTDVNPAGRAPARLAAHCCLATGGPGAAMRHAPFGRPRHPLGTFPCGKVPRPPAGGRNLPQEADSLWKARKKSSLAFLCFAEGFASAEATKGLSDRPLETFGSPCSKREAEGTAFLWKARERAFLARGFRLCGGDQRAFRSPFGNLRVPLQQKGVREEQLFCGRQGKGPSLLEGFASAEATKGLFGRPLETFGAHRLKRMEATRNRFLVEGKGKEPFSLFSVSQELSPLRRRPGGFPIAPWTPSGNFYLRQSPTHRLFLCILVKKYQNNKPTSPAPFLALLW